MHSTDCPLSGHVSHPAVYQRQVSYSNYGFQVASTSPSHAQPELSLLPASLNLSHLYLSRDDCFGVGGRRRRLLVAETVSVGLRARFAFDLDVAVRLAVVRGVVLSRRSAEKIEVIRGW